MGAKVGLCWRDLTALTLLPILSLGCILAGGILQNHRSIVSLVPGNDLVQLPLAMLLFRNIAPVPYGFNNLCSALFISVFQLQAK